jgi:hypothetical protein
VDGGYDHVVTVAEIDRAADGAPLLQVAVDGWWEQAAKVELPTLANVAGRLLEGLPSTGDIAVEMLWPGPPIVFVGARLPSISVASALLDEVAGGDGWVPTLALEMLADGPLGPPIRAELGAVNAWRSVGPLQLNPDASVAAVESALTSRPELARCRLPVALEVVHQYRREAWWAIEVSSRDNGMHNVRAARTAQLLVAAR